MACSRCLSLSLSLSRSLTHTHNHTPSISPARASLPERYSLGLHAWEHGTLCCFTCRCVSQGCGAAVWVAAQLVALPLTLCLLLGGGGLLFLEDARACLRGKVYVITLSAISVTVVLTIVQCINWHWYE